MWTFCSPPVTSRRCRRRGPPSHPGLHRHELSREHDLVVGNLLEQAHLDERLLERRHRFRVEHAVVGEDADLLVVGAADHRRAQVEHLGGDVHGLRLVGLHEGDGVEPCLQKGAYRLRRFSITSSRAKMTWVMKWSTKGVAVVSTRHSLASSSV